MSSYDQSYGALDYLRVLGPHFPDAPLSTWWMKSAWHRDHVMQQHGPQWPADWWTCARVDAHCERLAQCQPQMPCTHCACRWRCDECRNDLLCEAVVLRFEGSECLQSWLQEREEEQRLYDEWRVCREVIQSLVCELERRDEQARAAEQKAAAKARAVLLKEQQNAALTAAGLEPITEQNARRWPPPRLFERSKGCDHALLHARQEKLYCCWAPLGIFDKGVELDLNWEYQPEVGDPPRPIQKHPLWPDRLAAREAEWEKYGWCKYHFDHDSVPAQWCWQMTGMRYALFVDSWGWPAPYTRQGIHIGKYESLYDRYDRLVRQWHQLAGKKPPKRYGTDHRDRGGKTTYVLVDKPKS